MVPHRLVDGPYFQLSKAAVVTPVFAQSQVEKDWGHATEKE